MRRAICFLRGVRAVVGMTVAVGHHMRAPDLSGESVCSTCGERYGRTKGGDLSQETLDAAVKVFDEM